MVSSLGCRRTGRSARQAHRQPAGGPPTCPAFSRGAYQPDGHVPAPRAGRHGCRIGGRGSPREGATTDEQDADGIWSVTIGPMPPEIWIYKAMGVDRYLWVYTPPNYDTSTARYPVYYLLHGNGETQSGWVANGRANFILDNLIAEGRRSRWSWSCRTAIPCRVRRSVHSRGPAAAAIPECSTSRCSRKTCWAQVIPFVERRYRVYTDAGHRAIGGLSMGAFQSLEIGLAHPELFRSVLAYSGGFGSLGSSAGGAMDTRIAVEGTARRSRGRAEEPASAVPRLRPGRRAGMLGARAAARASFQAQGVRRGGRTIPGGHVFSVWRNLLHESVPLLFTRRHLTMNRPGRSPYRAPLDVSSRRSIAIRLAARPAKPDVDPRRMNWITTWATSQLLAPTRVAFGGRDEPAPPPPGARVPATLRGSDGAHDRARASIGGRRGARPAGQRAREDAAARGSGAHRPAARAGGGDRVGVRSRADVRRARLDDRFLPAPSWSAIRWT